jgi:hypothetical protein
VITTSSTSHLATAEQHTIGTPFFSLVWHEQQFFLLKFYISTEMPMRGATFANKIALVEQIKNQPPNTSHHQLAEINGEPKSTKAASETTR